jgi:hypothetical protein
MEIKGKVIYVANPVTGMGKKGQWKKTEFVIKTSGEYPKEVCLSLFNKDLLARVGNSVEVSLEPESREYNGRWYTECKAWKVQVLEDSPF